MANTQAAIRTLRGIQHSFPLQTLSEHVAQLEPKGVVYTKRWVVELLLDLAGYISSTNLIDAVAVEPAAGEGAFLGVMVERLTDSCRRLRRPISDCRHSLIAYELDEASAERARMLAAKVLLDKGVDSIAARLLAQSWVRTGDYLFDSMSIEADFVIGNPPYVRLEDIPAETVSLYRGAYPTMRGRADIYVAFFEAALRQLKEGGACAFICADRWMRNQYGAELRELITSAFSVDVIIEMHDADAFHDEVDAYPAISVIRRNSQACTVVASAGSEAEQSSADTLATALLDVTGGGKEEMPRGLRIARVDTWFQGRDPWPCKSPEQLALLRHLEERFSPLESNARVGIGVATGNDKVFVTKDANLVESSRLLKLAMPKDLASGSMVWSGHYLVNPWNCNGLVKLNSYPRLGQYFEKHGEALKGRHTAIKNTRGWYKTIDRVVPGLTGKRKLYIADIKSTLDPVLDNGETYPHHNIYFIESDDWNLEVLGGLLMSSVGQFFIEAYGVRMRGGYMRFQAQYLRRIRVPHPNAVSTADARELIAAFRSRDRNLATQTALRIYGIDRTDTEIVIEH